MFEPVLSRTKQRNFEEKSATLTIQVDETPEGRPIPRRETPKPVPVVEEGYFVEIDPDNEVLSKVE
jgi:type 1 glutamine amidotransferase